MNELDFMIIGAQKSATTALYTYLNAHPDIAMPAAKEAPFFDGDTVTEEAWASFSGKHFPAPDGRRWGKASPQYMGHPLAAARIAHLMPDTRLIAILRDPIERAWSHYQMCRRREVEPRSFDMAVDACLDPVQQLLARDGTPPRHAEGYEGEGEYYLAWSEYGRILENYLAFFPRRQLLVLTTEELKQDPAAALDRVLEFVGLAPGFRPSCLGEVVHRGGGQPLISSARRRRLRAIAPLRWAWQRVPAARREALRYWFDQKNVRHGPRQEMVLSARNEVRLREHFAADVDFLRRRLGLSPAWGSRYASAVANCDRELVA